MTGIWMSNFAVQHESKAATAATARISHRWRQCWLHPENGRAQLVHVLLVLLVHDVLNLTHHIPRQPSDIQICMPKKNIYVMLDMIRKWQKCSKSKKRFELSCRSIQKDHQSMISLSLLSLPLIFRPLHTHRDRERAFPARISEMSQRYMSPNTADHCRL